MPRNSARNTGGNQVLASLEAEAFVLSFEGIATFFAGEPPYFDGSVSLRGTSPSASASYLAKASFPLRELEELCAKLEEHTAKLPLGPLAVDQVLFGEENLETLWLPLDLSLRVECLNGETAREGEKLVGEFEIRVMMNLSDPEGAKHLYGGFESPLDVQEAERFARAVREEIG